MLKNSASARQSAHEISLSDLNGAEYLNVVIASVDGTVTALAMEL